MSIMESIARMMRAALSKANPRDPVVAQWFGGAGTGSGVAVTPVTAMQQTAVYAAVRILAESVASLPLGLYRRIDAANKEPAPDHPLHAVLSITPNRWQTAMEFREMLMGHLALRGNAYARIVFSGAGRIEELVPLHPDKVTPFWAPGGTVAYRYVPATGAQETLLQGEVFHVRGLSSDGLVGIDPIGAAREAIGLALAAEQFGAAFFGNDTTLGLTYTHPGVLSDEAYARLKASLEDRFRGPRNAHRPAILEEGLTPKSIGIEPEKAQFLGTRKFQVLDIARIFRVPPHLLMDLDRATFSNIEQQGIDFVTHTIRPWLVRWEQAIARDLLTDSDRRQYFARHRVEGLLRGDSAARSAYYTSLFNIGVFSVNDIRALEESNPVVGGERHFVALNMTPLDSVGEDGNPDAARSGRVLAGAVARMATKESGAVCKARERCETDLEFSEWADHWYPAFTKTLIEALACDPVCAGAYVETSRAAQTANLVDWAKSRVASITEALA